jgi:hypothetical protein
MNASTLLRNGTRIFWALMAAALIFTLTGNAAQANHTPADKVNASGSKIEVIEPEDTEVLLHETFKTSAPTDLMMHVTLECSIITMIKNQGGPDVESSTGEAEGRIRVWLEFDGKMVPINTQSSNPQPHDPTSPGEDTDRVTFCNNQQRFTVTDTEDGDDGTDTYETYLKTKAANAFNWVYLNTGSGMHTVELKARYDEPTTATTGSSATGMVGNRMLIIEPTKMSNHEGV